MSNHRSILSVLLVLITGSIACATATGTKTDNTTSRLCVANQTFACACGNLSSGTQTCSDDQVLSECDCSPAGKERKPGPTKETQGSNDSELKEKKKAPDTDEDIEDIPNGGTSSGGTSSGGPGVLCLDLMACCDNLRKAGITGSAGQCDRTSLNGDEWACHLANEEYKKPEDYYDPVCF